MIQFAGKLLISFLISNWVYCEVVLFVPPVGKIGERFMQVAKIPTHDEWPAIASSPRARALNSSLNVTMVGLTGESSGIFGPAINHLWSAKTSRRVARLFQISSLANSGNGPAERLPYIKGSEMFDRSAGYHPFQGEVGVF